MLFAAKLYEKSSEANNTKEAELQRDSDAFWDKNIRPLLECAADDGKYKVIVTFPSLLETKILTFLRKEGFEVKLSGSPGSSFDTCYEISWANVSNYTARLSDEKLSKPKR